ncbi:MAG: helix-turn-helix domain-containing protein [Ruminococcus flavefaciens]|nr:helix-turn-helix domain-containing protein [Ruminococcus flavefaciens]MCM1058732.1 helix-turn-helix domain-containing protein [Eubacterium sp.]
MYEIIKQLCYENNITISKLCEMVTNSTGNLATWKKDYMRSDYLKKVADYFQVSTDYLLGREEKNFTNITESNHEKQYDESTYQVSETFSQFYENLTKLCNEKNISPTATLQKLKISTSKLTAWKKGSLPNASVLILLSEFFGVSIDYLLIGKEKNAPAVNLKADEQELLKYYSELCDIDKGKVIGVAKSLADFSDERKNGN